MRKTSWDGVDPAYFLHAWLDKIEPLKESDIKTPNIEKLYEIMEAYHSLSTETKLFIHLLHIIPSETLELLLGKRVHLKINIKKQFFKYISQFVKPGRGRKSQEASAKIEQIKKELKSFSEELNYEKD